MKKLLSIAILVGAMLIPSVVLASQPKQYDFVARVDTVHFENGVYYTNVIDENGDEWIVEADNDLSEQWLYVHANDMGTKDNMDDEILGFEILPVDVD